MRRIISFIFLLFVAMSLSSQTFRVSIEPGYGFYDMEELRETQEAAVSFYPGLGIKAVEKFPPFFNQGGSILWYATPNLLMGFAAEFLSTGGRNSVKDYSGEYKLDMMVNANLYGLETEYNFQLIPKLTYYLNLKIGAISSTLDVKESFVVSNTTLIDESNTIKESNLYIEPSTGIRCFINRSFSLSVGIGYLKDFGGDKDEKLMNWGGYHLKSGIAYSF